MAVQEMAVQGRGRLVRLTRFLREVRSELKKVSWPSKKELTANTIVVLVSVFFAATVIWIIDGFFAQILKVFIAK
ncbi:MAG TPA: preprotein translocase subunit SecE [Negativicutes bacterium]|nr:preprotein translocase subunit SecE [Negativicutes bacterium]